MLKRFSLVLHCVIMVSLSDGQSSCYNDTVACVRTTRQVLVNTSYYWFGITYNETCQQSSTSIACDNPEPTRFSIASRLFGLSDVNNATELVSLTSKIKLTFVTYNSSAGSINACGHNFKIPEVTNHVIDPLRTLPIYSWSLQNVPVVSWDSPNTQTFYTVIFWDAGHYNLHGLYINCPTSSLVNGTVITSYTAPSNPYYVDNPILIVVIPQTGILNQTSVQQTVEANTRKNQGRFIFSEFRTALSNELAQKPSHINIITLEADPFSIQTYKDKSIVDNCPLLVSRLPALHRVAELSNVSLNWGDTLNELAGFNDTYLPSLTLDISVVYRTDDFRVEYCCTEYIMKSGSMIANPFDQSPVRAAMVRNKPQVAFSPMDKKAGTAFRGQKYTLFMLDVFPAVEESQVNPRYFTHWLVTNINNGDIDTGDELCEYFGPNPIVRNEPRTYMLLLFRQPVDKINNSAIDQFCPNGRWICQISLAPVLKAWNLTDLEAVTWYRVENDGFAMMRTYNVLKMRTMDEVCANLPGYYRNKCSPLEQTTHSLVVIPSSDEARRVTTSSGPNSSSSNNNAGGSTNTSLTTLIATITLFCCLFRKRNF